MILQTFQDRLYPHKGTEHKLSLVLTRCRELSNAALSERKDASQYAGKSISWFEQKRDLPQIKQQIRPEYQELGSHVLQDVLHRLNKACDTFFRRGDLQKAVLLPGSVGYPRFQGRKRYDSFTYPDGAGWKFNGQSLHLTQIGRINVKLHRP